MRRDFKMKLVFELGALIEKYRKQLFDEGYSYADADGMVKEAFEESGLKFQGFMELEKEDIKKCINHLNETFAK